MRFHRTLALTAAIAAALSASSARAEITEAAAKKQLKKATQARYSVFQKEVKAAIANFSLDRKQFEADVASGNYSDSELVQLFFAATTMQEAVQDAMLTAVLDAAADASAILLELSGGASLNGDYPQAFYSGAGGVWDQYRDKIERFVDKRYKKVAAKLRATGKLLQKKAGVGFTFRLRRPGAVRAAGFNEFVSWFMTSPPMGIDTVFGIGHLGDPQSGRICYGGQADDDDTVNVSVSGSDFESASVSASQTRRWAVVLTKSGSMLKAGNYTIRAQADAAGAEVEDVIAIRS